MISLFDLGPLATRLAPVVPAVRVRAGLEFGAGDVRVPADVGVDGDAVGEVGFVFEGLTATCLPVLSSG